MKTIDAVNSMIGDANISSRNISQFKKSKTKDRSEKRKNNKSTREYIKDFVEDDLED